jgi:hypothetical protein
VWNSYAIVKLAATLQEHLLGLVMACQNQKDTPGMIQHEEQNSIKRYEWFLMIKNNVKQQTAMTLYCQSKRFGNKG